MREVDYRILGDDMQFVGGVRSAIFGGLGRMLDGDNRF